MTVERRRWRSRFITRVNYGLMQDEVGELAADVAGWEKVLRFHYPC